MYPLCPLGSFVDDVKEVGDVVFVVDFSDDQMAVESSVDVSMSGVDLVVLDEGGGQFLESCVADVWWNEGEEDLSRDSSWDEGSESDSIFVERFAVELISVDCGWQGEENSAGFLSSVVVLNVLNVEDLMGFFCQSLEKLLDTMQWSLCSSASFESHEDGVVGMLVDVTEVVIFKVDCLFQHHLGGWRLKGCDRLVFCSRKAVRQPPWGSRPAAVRRPPESQ